MCHVNKLVIDHKADIRIDITYKSVLPGWDLVSLRSRLKISSSWGYLSLAGSSERLPLLWLRCQGVVTGRRVLHEVKGQSMEVAMTYISPLGHVTAFV